MQCLLGQVPSYYSLDVCTAVGLPAVQTQYTVHYPVFAYMLP